MIELYEQLNLKEDSSIPGQLTKKDLEGFFTCTKSVNNPYTCVFNWVPGFIGVGSYMSIEGAMAMQLYRFLDIQTKKEIWQGIQWTVKEKDCIECGESPSGAYSCIIYLNKYHAHGPYAHDK